MAQPAKIVKLDQTVVNRIAAGEIIQRPANALKELLENSLDAKSTNIQVSVKEGGLKFLQIQDNGTGIAVNDLGIVCERFTTSKLKTFEDLQSISTYGFRGEALASISHIAKLTITTKTANEKCAYKASYVDSKLVGKPAACAGNQGTIITVENLFYNVSTRRKALNNINEEFSKISDVVTKYAIHNPSVGFTLKKHGETMTVVRTPQSSTKINNVRHLYGNEIARELLEIELNDDMYQFKLHALITNANFSSKKITLLLFINNRLVESNALKKTIEDMYTVYLPKKAHPWCYVSLQIAPQNVDVNVHPTKHEVRFLHEDIIIEKIKTVLDEKLVANDGSRTFYIQAKLPKFEITKEAMREVLPNSQDDIDGIKKIYPKDLIRTSSTDQKLDKFHFTNASKNATSKAIEQNQFILNLSSESETEDNNNANDSKIAMETNDLQESINTEDHNIKIIRDFSKDVEMTEMMEEDKTSVSDQNKIKNKNENENENNIENLSENENEIDIESLLENETQIESLIENENEINIENLTKNQNKIVSLVENETDFESLLENETQIESSIENENENENENETQIESSIENENENKDIDEDEDENEKENVKKKRKLPEDCKPSVDFKSYSVNEVRVETKLLSVLTLRKEIEDTYHEGLREVLSNLIFVGCVDETLALIQSDVKLYLCNTQKLVEELFYEIMLYDFANYGVIKFSESILIKDLAVLGLETEEAGWTEDLGSKEELAMNAQELLLEKADMLRQYFSIYIDKKGYIKSLPILLENYFPNQAELPLYLLRLATEVDWTKEKPCFNDICRETAKFYSKIDSTEKSWKHVVENILYTAIKESLLPPKHFLYDSTILEITSLPKLYKVFERC